jgi:hypothetical protein
MAIESKSTTGNHVAHRTMLFMCLIFDVARPACVGLVHPVLAPLANCTKCTKTLKSGHHGIGWGSLGTISSLVFSLHLATGGSVANNVT